MQVLLPTLAPLVSVVWAALALASPDGGARATAAATAKPATAKSAPPSAATATPSRLELKTVVDRVQKRYDGAKDFRARFNQTLTNAAFARQTSSSGEVLLKKPGRMRWNYALPEPKMYLADGNTLWLFEPEDRQAFKQDLKSSQLPAALAFLTGQGKLTSEFDVTFAGKTPYGTARDVVLSLSPRTPQAQVKTILFVVDPATFNVRESVITDGQGNVNDLLFSDIRVNTGVPDATFHWAPPPGVRLIDAAKLGR
jgi:outer membrane lipoprotein carrier protein